MIELHHEDRPAHDVALGNSSVEDFWPRVVALVAAFARDQGVPTRDMLVLLPFAQHVALAEAAWAALPGATWMPRFDTTETLARRSAAPREPAEGAPSLDLLADTLAASQSLRRHLPAKLLDEPARVDALVRRVVEATHALARTRLALPPDRQAGWLDVAARVLPSAGPAGKTFEAALAAFASAWAAGADSAPGAMLHATPSPARLALRVGAVDPAVAAWIEHGRSPGPALWLDADLPLDDASRWPPAVARTLTPCFDFEDEAQRSAAQVLAHVARGETPVALIALDRVLLRRVRALLERRAVVIDDESGWMLSTTRAGAAVVALLGAVQPGASADAGLDALTSLPLDAADALAAFDAWLRRRGVTAFARLDGEKLDDSLQPLWRRWLDLAEPLRSTRYAGLGHWLDRLRESLQRSGLAEALQADAAGAQVLAALRLDGAGWPASLAAIEFDAAGFSAWVRSSLESVAFRPPSAGEAAQVVITPLARAALRPFAAAVCPGADAAHLGAPTPPALLGDAAAAALGVPTAAERVAAERRALAQLLRLPRLAFFVRRSQGAEPVLPAAALLELAWAAERAGMPLQPSDDHRVARPITAQPVPRPRPRAPALRPAEVNATAYEALRACPYRYFALRMLKLAEAEELDDAVDAREHGTWLHALLRAFHEGRDPAHPEGDAEQLAEAARAALDGLGRDDEDFLPFQLAFDAFAPRYLAWLHEQEAEGWQVRQHEWALQLDALELPGHDAPMPAWRGRIDRVDVQRAAGRGERWRILDYKASAASGLEARVRQPFEDTQLAFYAALASAAEGEPPGGIEAAYLALDTNKHPRLVPHKDVETSAEALTEGLAEDFERIAAGAALPALGEGRACEFCAARGLCRRDFWADEGGAR